MEGSVLAMLPCDALFRPREFAVRDALAHAVSQLFAARQRQGQVWGEPVMLWDGGAWNVRHWLPRTDALARHHESTDGRHWLAQARALTSGEPRFVVHPDEAGIGVAIGSLRGATSLVLDVQPLAYASPVLRGDDGRAIPLYELPIAESRRAALTAWARMIAAAREAADSGGALAMAAQGVLASERDGVQAAARVMAYELEQALGLPCFLRLGEAARDHAYFELCPVCTAPWRTHHVHGAPGSLPSHPLRCDRCRVLSSDRDHAHAELRLG